MDIEQIRQHPRLSGLLTDVRYERGGGMGDIHAARLAWSGVAVAVKTPAADRLAMTAPRIENEAAVLREVNRLDSAHLPRLLHAFSGDGFPALVIEWFPAGEPLANRLERRRLTPRPDGGRGGLGWQEFLAVFLPVTAALRLVHERRIVHRDVKPGNIWVAQLATGALDVLLFDFGASKLLDRPGLTTLDQFLGTPRYCAPEHIVSAATVGPPADVFALGMSMYEALFGALPFDRGSSPGPDTSDVRAWHLRGCPLRSLEDLQAARPDVPPAALGLIASCLDAAAAARPSAADVEARILSALGGGWVDATGDTAFGSPLGPSPAGPAPLDRAVAALAGEVAAARKESETEAARQAAAVRTLAVELHAQAAVDRAAQGERGRAARRGAFLMMLVLLVVAACLTLLSLQLSETNSSARMAWLASSQKLLLGNAGVLDGLVGLCREMQAAPDKPGLLLKGDRLGLAHVRRPRQFLEYRRECLEPWLADQSLAVEVLLPDAVTERRHLASLLRGLATTEAASEPELVADYLAQPHYLAAYCPRIAEALGPAMKDLRCPSAGAPAAEYAALAEQLRSQLAASDIRIEQAAEVAWGTENLIRSAYRGVSEEFWEVGDALELGYNLWIFGHEAAVVAVNLGTNETMGFVLRDRAMVCEVRAAFCEEARRVGRPSTACGDAECGLSVGNLPAAVPSAPR